MQLWKQESDGKKHLPFNFLLEEKKRTRLHNQAEFRFERAECRCHYLVHPHRNASVHKVIKIQKSPRASMAQTQLRLWSSGLWDPAKPQRLLAETPLSFFPQEGEMVNKPINHWQLGKVGSHKFQALI